MLIEFDPIIFQDDRNTNKFNFLFNLCYIDRRYDLFIDLPQIITSPLFGQLNTADQELIKEYFNSQITSNNSIDFFISDHSEEFIYSLDEGITFLNQPLTIILENSLNDNYFLQAIVDNFSKKGKKIRRHLEKRWISIGNAGGCENIPNFLRQILSTFDNLPKPQIRYIRGFVLIDSDSSYPGQILDTRSHLADFLNANEIPFHILTKREMENYLPEEAFDDIAGNTDFINAYKRLSPIQKDYFDIQKGFENKNFNSYHPEVQLLYNSVSPEDKILFRKSGLLIAHFKSEFPKLFNSKNVTQDSLKRRVEHQGANANELQDILFKINELL
jgi:hypothetical protein